MNRTLSLLHCEARLFWRNPNSLFVGLLFPATLLLAQGLLIPGLREPLGAAGLRLIDLFVPVMLTVSMGSVALSTFPSAVGSYREQGVLRRLATTPVGPARVLLAQLGVSLLVLCLAVLLALLLAGVVLQIRLPRQPGVVAAAFLLGAAELLSLGALIAARARSAQGAGGVGMLVYFACLYTAGLWTPLALMPEGLRHLFSFTPMGAVSLALTTGWYGETVPTLPLLVTLAWTALLLPLAVRLFRWF